MKKIGRNEPCPCGSGKKYKNCHLGKPMPAGFMEGVYDKEPRNFEELVNTFSPNPIIKLLGILQIIPGNHGHNEIFERLSRVALVHRKEIDQPPYALYPVTAKIIKKAGGVSMLDAPTNAFTECAVFTEGNYVVYPGITLNGTEILNQLLECIFIEGNDYPEAFKKPVYSAANLLLLMSDFTAHGMGHTRYMYEPTSDEIIVPERDAFINQMVNIEFPNKQIERLCQSYGFSQAVLDDFTVKVGDTGLGEENPEENLVIFKPIIHLNDSYILYMPTTVVETLIRYIKRKSKEAACLESLTSHLHRHQFRHACEALVNMGWQATGIKLPYDESENPCSELVFQIDNQKFGYLCFIHTGNAQHFDLDKRNQQVISYLESLNPEQPHNVLSLFILAETGEDYLGGIPKPPENHLALMFRFGELTAVAYTEHTEVLTLWKFAKAFHHTNTKAKVFSLGGILDAYAVYDGNHGSLFHADDENPIGGVMVMAQGSANNYIRNAQKKRDEHAVRMFINGQLGYAKVIGHKQYAPIYKLKEIHSDHRLVIETYKMPIWICNFQAKDPGQLPWAHDACEAVAFWLHRMKADLEKYINELSFVQIEIEIVMDQRLLEAEDFIIQDIDFDQVKIEIEIDAPRIRLHVPFDFLYLVRMPDNRADKLLMKTVLDGIMHYVVESGNETSLNAGIAAGIVEKVMQPQTAKMMLFSDASQNVRMDNRKLPPARYIQDPDVSNILDNLVSWLPESISIPEKIAGTREKIALCDAVVTVLLQRLSDKLQEFDGRELLSWLVRQNEKCVRVRELYFILIPARIATFSSFKEEVGIMAGKEEDLVTTAHALRTLIEFVASKIPSGAKWPNFDDVDEMLAITDQVTSWGALSETMRLGINDPEMGILPSGRIGSDKTWQRQKLASYSAARVEADVFQYVEKFETKYRPDIGKSSDAARQDTGALDLAFLAEFDITLTDLSKLVGSLLRKGFQDVTPCTKLTESELIAVVKKDYPEMTGDIIIKGVKLMTLLPRAGLGTPPDGYTSQDIFPWRYTRQLSYLRRPLAATQTEGETVYYYGYRHIDMYFDNLLYLLYTGKLPETTSEKMDQWIGGILNEKGKPFRNEVRDWFKGATNFEVVDYEVKMQPGGPINAEKNYGDIDLLVIDHQKYIIYSLECKNGVAARNVHEMKVELDLYLGRDGNEKKAKIKKHVERDKWLKEHPEALSKLIADPHKYRIVSAVITSEEMSLAHITKEPLPLPIISFTKLRKDGHEALPF